MIGALRAHFVRHGARFVGHEPHRLHDATPLFIHGLVVRADQTQQRAGIDDGRAAAQAQLAQLGSKMGMQLGAFFAHECIGIDAYDGRRTGRHSLAGARGVRVPRIGARPEFRSV